MKCTRRQALAMGAGSLLASRQAWPEHSVLANESATSGMQLGLVTFNWGKTWDLPTVIRNCADANFQGVELRSTHAHGVEITLSPEQRRNVKRQFEDSPVTLVGLGSACEYHSSNPAVVKANIEETKQFVRLCHDVGGSGVKVRPNGFTKGVPKEKTLEQIGKSLKEVGMFAADFGIDIRLEVHGSGTRELPNIRTILDTAAHPNVLICWNCNPSDMFGDGLEANFRLVQDSLGTVHIHDLRSKAYPWAQLFELLKSIQFKGWTLLEEGGVPDDIPGSMRENRKLWENFTT